MQQLQWMQQFWDNGVFVLKLTYQYRKLTYQYIKRILQLNRSLHI